MAPLTVSLKYISILFLLSMLIVTVSTQQDQKNSANILKPLIFDMDKSDAQKMRIYWDPAVDVKKIKEISNRDVHYVINNTTGKVREEYSPWLVLVSEQDQVDPTQRLVFVKSDMCVEQDYRVSWYDGNGVLHSNVTQRMEPSPEPWKPSAKIQVSNLHYDGATKHILGNVGWAMDDEKLKGIPKLGSLHPSVQLESCSTLFDRPVPFPVVDPATKVVSFDPLYSKHVCALSLHLRQMTYNSELECRSLRETTAEHTDRIELSCTEGGQTNYPDCTEGGDKDQPCQMTCEQQISASAEFDWSRGWPKPLVKVEWRPRVPVAGKTAVSHLIRYAQVDSVYNNYPIEEFNVTFTETPANQSYIKLEPFSFDPESLYTFQVCTLYEACFATAKWSSVPKHPIHATAIVNKVPVPTTTTLATTAVQSIDTNGTTVGEKGASKRQQRSPVDPPPKSGQASGASLGISVIVMLVIVYLWE